MEDVNQKPELAEMQWIWFSSRRGRACVGQGRERGERLKEREGRERGGGVYIYCSVQPEKD